MSYTSFLSSQLSLVTVWFEANNLKKIGMNYIQLFTHVLNGFKIWNSEDGENYSIRQFTTIELYHVSNTDQHRQVIRRKFCVQSL